MEVLELLESVQQEAATVQKLFGDAGVRTPTRRGQTNTTYMKALQETAKLLADVKVGRQPMWMLQEAMSTSDFPILFGDVLDRVMLARYERIPEEWRSYARFTTVRNFLPQEIQKNWGLGSEGLLEEVKELEEYPERAIEEQARVTWRVKKYGARIGLSWEMIVNDENGFFGDLPDRLAEAARRTEVNLVSTQFIGLTGFNTSLYNNTNGNIVNIANGAATNNPPLSITALQDAMTVLSNMRDEDGQPIFIDMVTLVVPPALEIPARNLLNAIQLEITQAPGVRDGGSGEQRLIVQNWMRNRLQLVVNPYIPIRATSNQNTTWFLFAAPTAGRGAIWLGGLRGREAPELFIKEPNARRIGGGQVNPLDGDYDTDAVQYKVRLVRGVTTVDPKLTVASNGSGA